MRLIIPIRFHTRIASNSDELQKQVSGETQDFLKQLSAALSDNAEILDTEIANLIPVASPRNLVVHELIKEIEAKFDAQPNCTELVIDAGGPNFEDMPHTSIAYAIQATVTHLLGKKQDLKVLVTYYSEYDESDPCYSALRLVFEHDRGKIFFYRDASIQQAEGGTEYSDQLKQRIAFLLERAKKSTKERILEKIVCHIGAYSVPGSSSTIFDYYEGNNASSEVFQEIRDIIETSYCETGHKVQMLYDDSSSAWFARVVNNAVNSLPEMVVATPLSEYAPDAEYELFNMVFVPVCRTGASAQRVVREIISHVHPAHLNLWTLLDIQPQESTELIKKVILGDGQGVRIKSIIELGARGKQLRQIWGSIGLEPLSIDEINLAGKFRSESMWSMLYEVGVKPETEIPITYRPSLGTVMNSSTLVTANRQLLASKVRAVLRSEYGSIPGMSFTFLHADEDAANILATALKDVSPSNDSIALNSDLIGIARNSNDLEELRANAKLKSEDLGKYCESLLQHYESLNENGDLSRVPKMRVVLLLEFNATGRTMEGMRKFCDLMDWDVVTCIALANMIPSIPAEKKAKHSFYEFGYSFPDEARA